MRLRALYIWLFGAVVLFGCSGPEAVPSITENRTAVYEPGSPNFDMEVVSTIVEGRTGVDAYISIPHASLVFLRSGDGFRAEYDLHVTVTAVGQGQESPAYQQTWTDTLVVASYDETQSFVRHLLQERIELDAGEYEVEMALEDAENEAQMIRRQTVDIPPSVGGRPALSEILLRTSRDGEAFEPTVSIHLPGRFDSLQAITQLYNVPDPANVRLTLVQFDSDTTVATLPHWFTPSYFSMPYIGVDYENRDTVQVSRRTIRDAESAFSIQFDLPELDRGVYMVVVALEADEEPVESRRYFTVRSRSFPRIASLDEMVASLAYIAREAELEHIRASGSAEEMKRRFDAFWAERVPNRQAAASLLESYYERVEEANILFSNHKEGWKTDRGMIYIVFGPPQDIEDRPMRRDWFYYERGSFMGRRMPPFIFRRSTVYGLSGLFENYILQRSESYEEQWRRKREDWRDGTVL